MWGSTSEASRGRKEASASPAWAEHSHAISRSSVNSSKGIGTHQLTLNTGMLFSTSSVYVRTAFHTGLLSSMLNWKQVQRKDLITFAAHYPVTVCTYLPLCVLINQAQTTLSAPLHFSTWLATSNSRAQQPDETTCCCRLFPAPAMQTGVISHLTSNRLPIERASVFLGARLATISPFLCFTVEKFLRYDIVFWFYFTLFIDLNIICRYVQMDWQRLSQKHFIWCIPL